MDPTSIPDSPEIVRQDAATSHISGSFCLRLAPHRRKEWMTTGAIPRLASFLWLAIQAVLDHKHFHIAGHQKTETAAFANTLSDF